MFETFKKIGRLLSPRERRSAGWVFALMLASALLEVVGVASIMPFVAILSSPDIVESNEILNSVYSWLGFSDRNDFLFVVGCVVLVVFLTSLFLKGLNAYAIVRFSQMRTYSFSYALLSKYVTLPYEFFLNRNSADLSRLLFSEVTEIINGVVLPGLRVLSSGLVIISIFTLLLFIDPMVTAGVSIVLGGSFFLIYVISRRLLGTLGKQRVKDNSERFVIASETLGGIKELRLMGRERPYLDRFRTVSKRFAKLQATGKAIGDVPYFAIQGVAFGGILVLVLYLMGRHGGLQGALPLIALYAFAGYRLLPAFQEMFKNGTQLRFFGAALDNLQADLERESVHKVPDGSLATPLLEGDIELDSVSYAYPGGNGAVVSDLSLGIPLGACVAFVGTTGAGKSTTVDVVMGLLPPDSGSISIGGTALTADNLANWQRNIGYVPQSIYLADASVAENIAFGVEPGKVDMAAVERAAYIAHIHEFVASSLPDGYQTQIGERGTRLSGGQRQRIGIARALYHNPQVLVFDEATSALDNATESAVMEAVNELAGHKTIILIAHRLTTVERCDIIFTLSGGKLAGQGTYEELSASNAAFEKIAATRP